MVFKQTGTKGNEAHCFSIIAHERSLDLEAPDRDVARRWVEGLRACLKYGNVMSPQMLAEVEAGQRRKETEKRNKRGELLKNTTAKEPNSGRRERRRMDISSSRRRRSKGKR